MKYVLYVVLAVSVGLYLVADDEQQLQDDLGEVSVLSSAEDVIDQQEEPVKNHVGKKPKGDQAKSGAKEAPAQGKQDERAKSKLEIFREEKGLTIKLPKRPKIKDTQTPPVPKAASRPTGGNMFSSAFYGKRCAKGEN